MPLREFEAAGHTRAYAQLRSAPPESLIREILAYLGEPEDGAERHKLALDLGCGSGQATLLLAPHFEKVLGVDISPGQIEQARARLASASADPGMASEVSFAVEAADDPLPAGEEAEADLACSFMAAHWFGQAEFGRRCRRALRPGGAVAVAAYGSFPAALAADGEGPGSDDDGGVANFGQLDKFYQEVAAYGHPVLQIWAGNYVDFEFPFGDVRRTMKHFVTRWVTADQLASYCRTYSLYQNMRDRRGEAAAEAVVEKFVERTLAAQRDTKQEGLSEGTVELVHCYQAALCRKPLEA